MKIEPSSPKSIPDWTSTSSASFPTLGSMFLMIRLHLTRSCASSPDNSFSDKSFLVLSNHFRFGLPLLLFMEPTHTLVPASTYGLKTLALSELHQHKLQVRQLDTENSRSKESGEEGGTKACIVGKIVNSRMKWGGHMVRMKYDKLPKRSNTKKHDGCRNGGISQLRWDDCVKRDLRKAEEEEKRREKANNKDQWKRIIKVAVHRSDE